MARPEGGRLRRSPSTGSRLKAGDNYWQLLNDPLNEYVTFKVADAAAAGDTTPREVRIKTVPSL